MTGVIRSPRCRSPTIPLCAGVVGLSVALHLQRAGMQVAVLDPLGPAGGASFGNAGMLSPDTAAPIAMPGMLRKVPGWLRDPLGPLAVRPSYFPRAVPWLLQWVKAGRLERVFAISDAMRALHRDTLTCWRELLGDALYRDLIRPSGQVHVWEGDDTGPTEAIEQQIRDRHGIAAQPLGADDLRQMFPGSPATSRVDCSCREMATPSVRSASSIRWLNCSARRAARSSPNAP